MEKAVYGYYGWTPSGAVTAISRATGREADLLTGSVQSVALFSGGNRNLRSMAAVKGYHVEATDGAIGHIENFIIEDISWDVRYLVIDTKNWWVGQHVLMSPFAVRQINWMEQNVRLDVSRYRVKNSPPWKPLDLIDNLMKTALHGYYGWPGYGF